jgi:hypothetical protein
MLFVLFHIVCKIRKTNEPNFNSILISIYLIHPYGVESNYQLYVMKKFFTVNITLYGLVRFHS